MSAEIVKMRESIIERSKKIRRARERKVRATLGSTCTVLLLMLLNVMGELNSGKVLSTGNINYGTLMLSPQSGGYVLVGVICFVIGAAFAVLCVQRRKHSGREDIN